MAPGGKTPRGGAGRLRSRPEGNQAASVRVCFFGAASPKIRRRMRSTASAEGAWRTAARAGADRLDNPRHDLARRRS